MSVSSAEQDHAALWRWRTEPVRRLHVSAALPSRRACSKRREFHLQLYSRCLAKRKAAEQKEGKGRAQGGQETSHAGALDDYIFAGGQTQLAVGETVILLHPPLPSLGVSIWIQISC